VFGASSFPRVKRVKGFNCISKPHTSLARIPCRNASRIMHKSRRTWICGMARLPSKRLKGSLKTTQPLADVPGQPLLSEKRVLKAWLAERGNHPSKYVFVSQKSGRVHRSQFYRIFADAAERAGLPADKRHPHCLKHALGFALVGANVNLAIVKQALGHKSIASTSVYTQPTDEMAGRAVVAALASL